MSVNLGYGRVVQKGQDSSSEASAPMIAPSPLPTFSIERL